MEWFGGKRNACLLMKRHLKVNLIEVGCCSIVYKVKLSHGRCEGLEGVGKAESFWIDCPIEMRGLGVSWFCSEEEVWFFHSR